MRGTGASAAGAGSADVANAAGAGGEEDARVLRVRREALAHHHAGLGVKVGVRNAGDAGDDGAVAGQFLVDEVEGVGGSPDVGPGAADGVGSVGNRSTAGNGDAADVALRPRRRQAGGCSAAATSARGV